MPLSIPPEMVEIVGKFIDPNPFTYLKLSHVSRSFRSCFLSVEKWHRLQTTPDDCSRKFIDRMSDLSSKQASQVREIWTQNSDGPIGIDPQLVDNIDYIFAVCTHSDEVPEQWERYFSSETFMWSVIMFRPLHLRLAPQFLENRKFVTDAVSRNWRVLKFTPLANDREIATIGIGQNGEALQYARSFRNDLELAKLAASTSSEARLYVGAPFFLNKSIVMASFEKKLDYNPLELDSELQTPIIRDKEVVLRAASLYDDTLLLAPSFKDDRDVVMAAVKHAGSSLEFAGPKLRDDPDIVEATLRSDPAAHAFASERLKRVFKEAHVGFMTSEDFELGRKRLNEIQSTT